MKEQSELSWISDANRRPRLPGGRAAQGDRARRRALGAQAIQIFNQSPRMWRPTAYGEDDFAAFREAMSPSAIKAVLIHAVYLINCATEDAEIRQKSHASLVQSLTVGAGIGAAGVVLHPGSAKQGDVGKAIKRAGKVIAEALSETEGCELHLENTAGAGGTLGRSFEELAALLEAAGGDQRLGVCLDSCHLLASGYDIRTIDGARRGARPSSTPRSAWSGCDRCTSTTRRRRWAPTATATPTSARARSATDRLRGVPVRAAIRHTPVRARDARARSRGTDHGGARALRQAAQARAGARRRRARRRPSCMSADRPAPATRWSCSGSPATWPSR